MLETSLAEGVKLPRVDPRNFLLLSAIPAVIATACLITTSHIKQAVFATAIGIAAFITTFRLIPHFASKLDKRGLCGDDLNKPREGFSEESESISTGGSGSTPKVQRNCRSPHSKARKRSQKTQVAQLDPSALPRAKRPIPEALGVVAGFVYLVAGVLCYLTIRAEGWPNALDYVSGLLCIVFITFLGFVDDVCDLRWRYKVVLPLIASLPLLIIYDGPTSVIVPSALKRPVMEFLSLEAAESPLVLELGILYYAYMASLTIFCSNAINIYAGLNGLEVGQSIVIAVAIIGHNTSEMVLNPSDTQAARQHCLSLILNIVFLSCAGALYAYNRYPSSVFVGDTFTYFAGVHFAVVGIVGHFAKTLLLFFLPQIVNFIVSLPQLLGFMPCPRHRVPTLNETTGKLEASPNLTVMNLTLRCLGPMTEKSLVDLLLAAQILCCICALAIRYSPIYNTLFL